MKKELQLIVDDYNKRQDEYTIYHRQPLNYKVGICHNSEEIGYNIGFYEWLFNPKYRVFEVFGIWDGKGNVLYSFFTDIGDMKQPSEIINYLYNSHIKGVENGK